MPITPHRLPASSHASTVQKLWEVGIDATRFLVPDEELARLFHDNPSRPANDISIARDDLVRQLDQLVVEQPPAKEEADGNDCSKQ